MVLIGSVLLSAVTALSAATADSGSMLFNRLSHADGMLHDNVTSVAQDSAGFIWLGTHRGLNRYDGYNLRGWKHPGGDPGAVYFNRINSIVCDGGLVWLATDAGLDVFHTSELRHTGYRTTSAADSVFFRRVRSVMPSGIEGSVWMSTGTSARLVCAETAAGDSLPTLGCLKIGSGNSFDTRGDRVHVASSPTAPWTWIAGQEHPAIYRRDARGNLDYVGVCENLRGYDVEALLADNGNLWIAYSNTVVRTTVNPDGTLTRDWELEIPTSVGVNSLAASATGVWVGARDGVFRLSKERPEIIEECRHSSSDPRSLINDVNSLACDRDGNLWVTGWTAGAAFANPLSAFFGTLRYPGGGMATSTVSVMHADPYDGYVYVGSKFGGIGRIDAATKRPEWNFSTAPELMRSNMTALETDSTAVYASVHDKVIAIDKRTGAIREVFGAGNGGYIFWIDFDRFGRLWLATDRGLECIARNAAGHWTPLMAFNDSPDAPLRVSTNQLHNICSDTEANELIITSNRGINRVILDAGGNVGRILHYTTDGHPGLSSDYLWAIDRAAEPHTYWVGSMGNGLSKIEFTDRESTAMNAATFGRAQGARSDDVESIRVDARGRVWCGGPLLSYFDEATGRFNTFDLADGLQGSAFVTAAATRDPSGCLWFGGSNGLNYFNPNGETQAPVRTEVVFTGVSSANGEFPVSGSSDAKITLRYPDNGFRADFSTLSYASSNHVRYRYRLEGYDNDWRYLEAGEAPSVSYTRLPYKKMRLVVEAGDWQQWSGQPAVLTVDSRAPWWLSWWMMTVYFLIGLALIAAAIALTIRQTRRKQAEAIDRHTREQERRMLDMKMKFFTDVSHEFRTPLTLIRHAAGQLSAEAPDSGRYVRLISRNAGVLTNMVNELLDFHRADLGSTPLRTTLTSVVPMVTSIVDELRGWAEESDLSLTLTVEEPDLEMWIDREQVSKIISNIVSNSIRYTDAPGSIEVTLSAGLYQDVVSAFPDRVALVSAMIPGRQLIVRVKDSGIGIAAEDLPGVFERFRQNAGSRRGAGSGIGLSLVKALIELHRGGLVASSRRGEGTEMIVFIPMTYDYLLPEQKVAESRFAVKDYLRTYTTGLSGAPAEAPEDRVEGNRPLLMVVDDNEEILSILSDFFAADYDTVLARDAAEALAKASDKLPDAIICDVMMPGMSGLELCQQLKQGLHTCHIPVILLTAMANEENQISGIETGADAYIAKPFNPKLLAATVRNLLNRSRRAPAAEPEPVSLRGALRQGRERELFERFEELVKANFSDREYKVESIWRELGINRTRLYSLVKEATGMSLGNHVRKLRLDRAATLMLTTEMSIGEIGFEVGIESASYFTRSFHEQFGMSPTEYIKKHDKHEKTD